MVTAGVQVSVAGVQRVLGSDDEMVPVGSEQLAEYGLGGPACVLVSGVDERAARVGEHLELFGALALRGPQPQSVPKVIVPSASSLTLSPDPPSNV